MGFQLFQDPLYAIYVFHVVALHYWLLLLNRFLCKS